ncbi:hypothetical protein PRIC1_008681 [Phytophthora ramorum]
MDGSALDSVSAEASGGVPLVSPPAIDVVGPSAAPGSAGPVTTGLVQPSQRAFRSTPNSTPKGSPARLTEASMAQYGQQEVKQTPDRPATPETASSGSSQRSGSDASEGEKGGDRTQNNCPGDANMLQDGRSDGSRVQQMQVAGWMAGQGVSGQTNGVFAVAAAPAAPVPTKKPKRWFDVIPMVLQNFKAHDQEQVKQLALPQCVVCKLCEKAQKAEVKCRQDDCKLVDQPLCSRCWETSHSSDEKKQHRQLPTAICQQCEVDRITFWCADCDLKFCQVCFDRIHSVTKTKIHRKVASEDAPGSCLVTSDWSEPFQNAIMQMIAARKHPPPASAGSGGDSIGGKRKRDIEVIVIDDDDDEDFDDASAPPISNGISEQHAQNTQYGINTGAENVGVENALTRSNAVFSQLQMPNQAVPKSTLFEPPVIQNAMIEPIPFPQELGTASSSLSSSAEFGSAPTRSVGTISSISTGNNTVNINTNAGSSQWNNETSQFAASASMGSTGYTGGMMSVTPSSTPASVSMANGVWSTNSAISTDLASTSNSGNLLPLGGAVFAENALVDSLIDRYHEMNQNVTNMELQSEQLTRQIAVATCQGPYAAGSIMGMLNKLQPVLEAARERRDKFLIAMIIQSNDIMAAVRLLRLTELGDVPQVPMISHRKCLQISNEINQHKKKLLELNQQLSETLNLSNVVSSNWENTLIRTTSGNIQMHEKSIKKLKKDREVEIVRIVQFSNNIRVTLKLAFQRSVEIRRQHQQQQQQQQFQPYG